MLWKALLERFQPKPPAQGDDNRERELPQRWRDPPPRPEKPGLFPVRHA